MPWLHAVAYCFGGALLTNAVPHFVRGVSGAPFQSPFAKPPGKGLSSSTVNVVWGFVNLVLAWLLLCHVGDFALKATQDVLPFGLGMLGMGLFMARHFGGLHGGNAPERS